MLASESFLTHIQASGKDELEHIMTKVVIFVCSKRIPGMAEPAWARARHRQLLHLFGSDSVGSVSHYASAEEDMLLCIINSSQDGSALSTKLRDNDLKDSVRWRLYNHLPFTVKARQMTPQMAHILLCVDMTPKSENEEDFNKWYDEEHILMLSRTPTWIYSARCRIVESSDNAPQYLAMHAWESAIAFESAAYEQAIDTPWKWKVVGSVLRRERKEYNYIGKLKVHDASHL